MVAVTKNLETHIHVNSQDGTDDCKTCGLGLRSEVHESTPYKDWADAYKRPEDRSTKDKGSDG